MNSKIWQIETSKPPHLSASFGLFENCVTRMVSVCFACILKPLQQLPSALQSCGQDECNFQVCLFLNIPAVTIRVWFVGDLQSCSCQTFMPPPLILEKDDSQRIRREIFVEEENVAIIIKSLYLLHIYANLAVSLLITSPVRLMFH